MDSGYHPLAFILKIKPVHADKALFYEESDNTEGNFAYPYFHWTDKSA